MRKLALLLDLPLVHSHPSLLLRIPARRSYLEGKVAEAMPLLGHRNWILIVDSAYPCNHPRHRDHRDQRSQLEVVRHVLATIDSIHPRAARHP